MTKLSIDSVGDIFVLIKFNHPAANTNTILRCKLHFTDFRNLKTL